MADNQNTNANTHVVPIRVLLADDHLGAGFPRSGGKVPHITASLLDAPRTKVRWPCLYLG